MVEGNNVHGADFGRIGAAADHWRLWKDDFALLKGLGLSAYRMSLDWSRIEPAMGMFNQAAMDQYRTMLLELKKLDIQVWLVLQDGSYPTWFTEAGGWRGANSVAVFTNYVQLVAQSLGDLVIGWTVLSEPLYGEGRGWLRRMEMKVRLGRVRMAAAKMIRAAGPLAQIDGYDLLTLHTIAVRTEDLLGVLRRYKGERKPMYIVDSQELADDASQGEFIRSRLRLIEEAQALGVNIRGYFYDSWLDGQNAQNGKSKKGLVAVDFNTQVRTLRPLAAVYKAIIQQATQSS
jgi:beta-glucosidase/6-phospho-beta-glucosidase/beta-galactosidase